MVPDHVIDVLLGILFLNIALFVLLYNLSFAPKEKDKRWLSIGMISVAAVITFGFVLYQVNQIEPVKKPSHVIKAVKIVKKNDYKFIDIVLRTLANMAQLSIKV